MTAQTVATQPLGWRRVTWFVFNVRSHRPVVWVALALGVLYGAAGLGMLLAPVLATTHPIWLLILNSKGPLVLVCAQEASWSTILPVVFVRQLAGDLPNFLLGRYNNDALARDRQKPVGIWRLAWWRVTWLTRGYSKLVKRFEKMMSGLGILGVLIWPSGPVLYAAGFSRLNGRWVAVADFVTSALRLWGMVQTPKILAMALSLIS